MGWERTGPCLLSVGACYEETAIIDPISMSHTADGGQENEGRICPLEYFQIAKQYGILIINTQDTPDAEFCLLVLMQNKVFLAISPPARVKYCAPVQHLL